MATLSRYIFYVFLILKTASVRSDTKKNERNNVFQSKNVHSYNGMMGVASVAEITSRNGRVSATGGIKFLPADSKSNTDPNVNQPWTFTRKYEFPTVNFKTYKNLHGYQWTSTPDFEINEAASVNDPWTFIKDTRFVASNSKINNDPKPWTITKKSEDGFAMAAVHASPGAVAVSAVNIMDKPNKNFGPINPFMNWPRHDFHPQSAFRTHSNLNSMFPEHYFKTFNPARPDFGNTWLFPIYDPFLNIWH